jgi:hypothetical protein
MRKESRLSTPDKADELLELLARAAEAGPSWSRCEIYLTPLERALKDRRDFRQFRVIKSVEKLIEAAKSFDRGAGATFMPPKDFKSMIRSIAKRIAEKASLDLAQTSPNLAPMRPKTASVAKAHDDVTWIDGSGRTSKGRVEVIIGDRAMVMSNGMRRLLPRDGLTRLPSE